MQITAKTLLALLLIVVTPLGCKHKPGGGSGNDIIVGEYGSMTGTEATFGQSTDEGIQLATDQVNQAGGLLGKQVKIIARDDQGSQDQAVSVVKELINREHAVAILGEVASTNSLAGGQVCEKAKVPMISPSSTNPKVTQGKQFVYRVCFTDDFQAKGDADFVSRRGWKNVAVLTAADSDYSNGLATFFKEEFKSHGSVVADEEYRKDDRDFKPQLTRIKAASPDVVYVPGYYTQVINILKQARELGLTVPFVGGDGWDSEATLKAPQADGCFFSNHYSPDEPRLEVQEFVKAYRAKFNKIPDAMAVTGYDAARVLFDAIKRAGSIDPIAISDAIAQTKNFPGASGTITVDAQHNARKPIVMLEIRGGKTTIADTIPPQ